MIFSHIVFWPVNDVKVVIGKEHLVHATYTSFLYSSSDEAARHLITSYSFLLANMVKATSLH